MHSFAVFVTIIATSRGTIHYLVHVQQSRRSVADAFSAHTINNTNFQLFLYCGVGGKSLGNKLLLERRHGNGLVETQRPLLGP